MIRPVSPVIINPSQTDEQGRGLPGPRSGGDGLAPLTKISGPDISGASDMATGLGGSSAGPSQHLNPHQWPNLPGQGMPEAPVGEGAGAAEGAAAGAGEAAGVGSIAELLPLLAL